MSSKLLAVGLMVALVAALSLASPTLNEPTKTVCFYESWAHWRVGDGKMDVNDIGNA